MTSQSSSTKKAAFLPLLFNTLHQKWTTGLLIAIINFFALPVPLLMMISADSRPDYRKHLIDDTLAWSEGIHLAMIPISSILAVSLAFVMLRYLHNKVSVDFYHSLPIRREHLLANQLVSGYLLLLVPTLIMLLLCGLVLVFNGLINAEILYNLSVMVAELLTYSLLFYSLATLVGIVSGATGVHIILTAVAIFILPFTYFITVYFAYIFNENMWASWYLSEQNMTYLTPVFRFLLNTTPLDIWEIILFLLVTAVFFALSFYIYRKYKSERAGNSMIFSPLGEVIKFILVFAMTLAGGLFFHAMMDNYFWTIFGMLCGGILTFMLTNTILQKSASAMFRGFRALIVYFAVISLGMVLLFFNFLGINTKVPEVDNIGKVEVHFDGLSSMEFKDKEVIAALRTLYTDSDWNKHEYGWEAIEEDVYVEYLPVDEKLDSTRQALKYSYINRMNLYVVFYPKFGLPLAKSVQIPNKNDFADEMRTILDSAEFKEQYIEFFESIELIHGVDPTFPINLLYGTKYDKYDKFTGYDYDNMCDQLGAALIADSSKVSYDYFQTQNYFIVNARTAKSDYGTRQYHTMYINSNMAEANKVLYENNISPLPFEEYLDILIDAVKDVTVINNETGEEVVYKDPSKMRKILDGCSMIGDFSYDVYPFTMSDIDYTVIVKYETVQKDDNTEIRETINSKVYFLKDRVPSFVVSDLAK